MGGLFRSEEMSLVQLYLQPEVAYSAMSKFGETGCAQFKDLNENVNVLNKKFLPEVKRLDEMEKKLKYFETEIIKEEIPIPEVLEVPKALFPKEILTLEAHLEATYNTIKEMSENSKKLRTNYLELIQLKQVLEKSKTFFDDKESSCKSVKANYLEEFFDVPDRANLEFIAGVINREKIGSFELMLWRVSKGYAILKQLEIEESLKDPATGKEVYKNVFVIFFQGEQLKPKFTKICEGFHASVYPCELEKHKRMEKLNGVLNAMDDLKRILKRTNEQLDKTLETIAKELKSWNLIIKKIMAIYHTLNFFNMDYSNNCLVGECWVPSRDVSKIHQILLEAANECGSHVGSVLNVIETSETPPTFHRTNKFSNGFQNLIDSYGVASYREVNPGLFTIVSFPFLFAVMFGDVGHAMIMFVFAMWLIITEKKIEAQKNKGEIFSIFFSGRYIILMMSLFSMYTGFLYNDIFSKSMNIFGTRWTNMSGAYNFQIKQDPTKITFDVDPFYQYKGSPYYMGIDPIWQMAKNKIIFLNSFKMKLSIILGVSHMLFGVCVSTFNMIHFRKYSDLVFEFLPKLLFLCLLFVYMIVMMFIKWIKYKSVYVPKGVNDPDTVAIGNSCAPSVLIYFINMMLFKENDEVLGCYTLMFDFQDILQKILVISALLCIPFLLLAKPLYIKYKRKQVQEAYYNEGFSEEGDDRASEGIVISHREEIEKEEEPLSEIFIHQAIETIEYVLSTISHTASYLRLWALSLAHSQLSEVLWVKIFHMGLVYGGPYVGAVCMYLAFMYWAIFTVGILVVIEGLSAFLHTLRLHWVEFLSKFYEGLGYSFQPFTFKTLIDEKSE